MQGGKDEVDGKIEQLKRILTNKRRCELRRKQRIFRKRRKLLTVKAEHPTYIVYDFEADVHTSTH
eukprot:295875-Alexandrium_andersonii.AAC.1